MSENQQLEREFQELLHTYCGAGLSDDQAKRLEEIFWEDIKYKQQFVEYVDLHAELIDFAQMTPEFPGLEETFERRASSRIKAHRRSVIASAISLSLLLVCTVGLVLWFRPIPEVPIPLAYIIQSDLPEDGPSVLTLGNLLPQGYQLNLPTGSLTWEYESGSRVSVSGPCRMTLTDPMHIDLKSGTLWAEIAEVDHGFIIDLPRGQIEDLGTEFGVTVKPDGSADVTVAQGSVSLSLVNAMGTKLEKQILKQQEHRIVPAYGLNLITPADPENRLLPQFSKILQTNISSVSVSGNIVISPSVSEVNWYDLPPGMIYIQRERTGVVLDEPLPVNLLIDPEFKGSYIPGNIPAGVVLDSYLVTAPSIAGNSELRENLYGKIQFREPILGIITKSNALAQTDLDFGTGVSVIKPGRGFDAAGDILSLSHDTHEIVIPEVNPQTIDQFRVLVGRHWVHHDEPTSPHSP